MKTKLLQGIAIVVLLLTMVTAGVLDSLRNADFIASEKEPRVRYEGEITFLADGKSASCYLSENDMNIDDDFEECLSKNYAGKRITNAVDWTGREYKQHPDDASFRSFDESKLDVTIAVEP